MSRILYSNQFKSVNDILNKGYPSTDNYDWKLETISKSEKDPRNNVEANLSSNASAMSGQIQSKCNCSGNEITTSASLAQIVKFVISRHFNNKNTKATCEVEANLPKSIFTLNEKFEFYYKNVSATLDATLPLATIKNSTVTSSVVTKKDNLNFGGEVKFDFAKQKIASYGVLAALHNQPVVAGVFLRSRDGQNRTIGVSFFRSNFVKIDESNVDLAAEISTSLNDFKNPLFSIGALIKPNSNSSIQTRFNTQGNFGINFTQNFSSPVSLTLSADTNLRSSDPMRLSAKVRIG
eukprot:TRINITY_DN856_c0_g1_i1.p1 TRINITY_DN856_c0_g1~~TRINITY_DN856_c0_g1_i1.p1  ORF type:complete len:293 (-),score=131.04 TRINITY_DN856_c0_g1_i1:144-1022(-)